MFSHCAAIGTLVVVLPLTFSLEIDKSEFANIGGSNGGGCPAAVAAVAVAAAAAAAAAAASVNNRDSIQWRRWQWHSFVVAAFIHVQRQRQWTMAAA
jgi:hypothetical protein